tara:strand:+ start:2120 stop:2866 length:747 start_codon:yes stop_codon:yes gene_type:complete
MQQNERLVVGGGLAVLLLGWLGFLVHSSPTFAGSGLGSAFGIAGAVLMLFPLAYLMAKRIPSFRQRITAHISLQSLMTLHVYTGILGPLLAIIHTGHKYQSWLGIMLTTMMLLVVVSGFVLRYLLTYVSHEIKDKLLLLQTARGDLDSAWGVLENSQEEAASLPKSRLLTAGLASLGIDLATTGGAVAEVTRLAESVADLEYAIRTHEFFKRWFSRALVVHIVLSIIFYVLLGLHIWAGIHFGLRWFS